jgi:hypothetical protein
LGVISALARAERPREFGIGQTARAESAIQRHAAGFAMRGRRSSKIGRRKLSGNSRYSCIDFTLEVNRAFGAGGFEFF